MAKPVRSRQSRGRREGATRQDLMSLLLTTPLLAAISALLVIRYHACTVRACVVFLDHQLQVQ